jgi:predicted phage-related endonuclease
VRALRGIARVSFVDSKGDNDFQQGYRIALDVAIITIIVIDNENRYQDCTMIETKNVNRMRFIGGSDAKVIMGKDEKALLRLWREKRGEEPPIDLSDVLMVQLGLATEDLNRRWYELNSGKRVSDIQRHVLHRTIPWMAATLDGLVKETGAVFEAKFMLPWSFSEAAAAEKHMAQLQHNMLVAGTKKSVLSIITGGGSWIQLSVEADPIYQTILIAAEKAFWQSVPEPANRRPCSIAIRPNPGSRRCAWST